MNSVWKLSLGLLLLSSGMYAEWFYKIVHLIKKLDLSLMFLE
jgi:hypothetical protein